MKHMTREPILAPYKANRELNNDSLFNAAHVNDCDQRKNNEQLLLINSLISILCI